MGCFQELCRRWEQYVLDHQAYTGSFEQCKSWVVAMRRKLQSQADVKGDKRSVQERIEKLQVCDEIYASNWSRVVKRCH
ncbi:hypothetical protein DPMN_019466 [Dreissena polymorpha]|uniref:Uncharacterized protein n=1 Tax=Dreissena polymorpha TaxID=45954 RepID=A0A9D4S9B5_DREPO|nr:hypothetical protein DPMN_019466 [Dreissena polymorpha]